jgi:hypothetical protein
MSHSEGFGSPEAIAACGVIVASIGVPGSGSSHATVSTVMGGLHDGSY